MSPSMAAQKQHYTTCVTEVKNDNKSYTLGTFYNEWPAPVIILNTYIGSMFTIL